MIKPNIGARVHNGRQDLLWRAFAGEIMDLREQRGTLVFRQIHLTDEELHRSKLAVAEPTV